jgi:protein-glutamine gamma-glutamyltransferase
MSVLGGIKKANEKGPPESSIAVRAAVLAAVLIAAHATLQQGVGGSLLWPATMIGLPVAFVFSYLMRNRPGFVVKLLLAIGMVLAVLHFVTQVKGSLENVAYLTRPLAELFVLTQLLHSFDVPARRDLRFSLVSSLTLIAIGGILSISSTFALNLALWSIAAIAALVLMERSIRRDLPQPAAVRSTAMSRPRRLRLAPVIASIVAIGVSTSAVFLVLPASGTSRSLTFPAELPEPKRLDGQGEINNPTLANNGGSTGGSAEGGGNSPIGAFGFTGFSKELDTSVRGRPDDTLVMRVRASKPAFWRGQSFDKWDGRTWIASDEKPKLLRGTPVEVPDATPGVTRSDDEFVQTFYLRTAGPNLVFAADQATRVYFPDGGLFVLRDGTMRSGVALERGAVYTVVSRRPIASEAILSQPEFDKSEDPTDQLSPEDAAKYLQLPSVPERVGTLAREVTAAAPTTIGKVRALENWMGANLEYSLDIPKAPKNTDAVDQFLFVDKVGFCEQIASSLVVMLRSLGIPARVTVGYTPGERNPLTGLFEVKASNAHAWAEVWFPRFGWLPFDPTESVPLADDEETPKARDGLGAYLGNRLPAITSFVLRGGGALAALAMMVFVFIAARRFLRRRKVLRARSWAERWHDDLDRVGRRAARPRAPGETARRYLDDLGLLEQDSALDHAVRTAELAAFSAGEPSAAERAAAERALRDVRSGVSAGRREVPLRRDQEVDQPAERQPAHLGR